MIRTIVTYSLLLLFSSWIGTVVAQNPFDLQHRIEEGEVEVMTKIDPGNPFEIEKKPAPAPKVDKANPETKVKQQNPSKPDATLAGQFKFWLLTISLVILTLLVMLYKSLIVKVYRAFINENFLKMIHRNEGRIVSIPYLLFYGLFLISLSTFIFLVSLHFGWPIGTTPGRSFWLCFLGVTAVFLGKHILLFLVGSIFPLEKMIRQYSFTIVIFNIILGLALVPFNLFIAFTTFDLARVLIYVMSGLIILAYLFRAFRGLLVASNTVVLYKFHFFMYLCTVEIAPALLILTIIKAPGL